MMALTKESIEQINGRLTEIPVEEYIKRHDEFLRHYPDVVKRRFDYDMKRAERDIGAMDRLSKGTPIKRMASYAAACRASLEQAAYDVCVKHNRRLTSQMGQELVWAIYDEGIFWDVFSRLYLPQVPENIRCEYEAECVRNGLPEDTAVSLKSDNGPREYVPDPYPGTSEKDKNDYIIKTNYKRTWQYNYDLQHPNEDSPYKKERVRRRRARLLKFR